MYSLFFFRFLFFTRFFSLFASRASSVKEEALDMSFLVIIGSLVIIIIVVIAAVIVIAVALLLLIVLIL